MQKVLCFCCLGWLIVSSQAQTPDLGGVKMSLDRYSGPAMVSAASLDNFKLRVQVSRNDETQPLNVRVELPASGPKVWPVNVVEVRDESGTALLVQRSGIEWEKLLIPLPQALDGFIVQAVAPSVPVPRTTSEKDRVIQDATQSRLGG